MISIGGRRAGAGKHPADRPNLIDPVVIGLSRRAGHELAFIEILADRGVRRVTRLAGRRAAPDVGGGDSASAPGGRAADRHTAAEPIIGEHGLLAGLTRIADPDQPVFGVPAVGARTIGKQIAVRGFIHPSSSNNNSISSS